MDYSSLFLIISAISMPLSVFIGFLLLFYSVLGKHGSPKMLIIALLLLFCPFPFFLLLLPFVLLVCLKRVPANTTIIIDRDSHFYKKKTHGFYSLGSKDKVTTKISEYQITENYMNIFKTHDDTYYHLTFNVTYYSTNVSHTLDALSDSRRSIYDICNCAAETVVGSIESKRLPSLEELSLSLFKQLESTLESFYIDVTDTKIISLKLVSEEQGQNQVFTKHESSGFDPIQ